MNNRPRLDKTINIIISETALTNIAFKESIDLALVCAAFDQKVNLVFVAQGVTNLIHSQDYSILKDKNHLDILKGLEFYDIDNIYAEKESLDSFNLGAERIIEQCKILPMKEIKKMHGRADTLVSLS